MGRKKSNKSKAFEQKMKEGLGVEDKPKRRGRKPKDPELIKEYYERKRVVFNPQSGTEHVIFSDVKPCQQVNEATQIGTRVLVARHPNFYKLYLYSYHKPGEPTFPRGGVKVWNANEYQMQSYYTESVAIHPDGGYHRFAGVKEIDVDNLESLGDNKGESNSSE